MKPAEPTRTDAGGRPLAAIIVASLALKLALLVPAHRTVPIYDAFEYERTALRLHRTGEYLSHRAPLSPAMLFACTWLTAAVCEGRDAAAESRCAPISHRDVARFVQVVFSTLSVWLVYLLGRELFDRHAGLVAAGLFAFYPDYVGFSHLLWGETQFVMLTVASLLLLVRGAHAGRPRTLCAAGIVLGLAALTRTLVLSLLPLVAAWMFVVRPRPRRRPALFAATVVVSAVVVIAPWTVRNAIVYGAFVPIEPRFGHALLWGATDDVLHELQRATATLATEPAAQQRIIESDRRARARALEIIRENPVGYLRRAVLVHLPRMWVPGSVVLPHLRTTAAAAPGWHRGYPPISGRLGRGLIVVFVGSSLVVMVLGLTGAALAPNWRDTLLLAGIPVQVTGLQMFLAAPSHRHRLFLMAHGILYAGFLLSRRPAALRRLVTPRRMTILAATLVVLALVLAGANYGTLQAQWRAFG
jgi:4-amino-4-deoxy-L-arabinose transferase-like glycosyltransferase